MKNNIDYYDNFISYVKIIMKGFEEKNESYIIKDVYNKFFNNCDNASAYITEMIIVTALFENRLYALSEIERNTFINSLYDGFVRPIVCNYSNGSKDASLALFHGMNERVKALVGYNTLYNNELFTMNSFKTLDNKKGMK